MKFFLIESDEELVFTQFLNFYKHIEWKQLGTWDIPRLNSFSVSLTGDAEFLDIITKPILMLSKEFSEIVQIYDATITFKYATLYDAKVNRHMTYGMPHLEIVDCLLPESELSLERRILKRVILRREAVYGRTLFQLAEVEGRYYVASLELVESAFRREVNGLKITEVELV